MNCHWDNHLCKQYYYHNYTTGEMEELGFLICKDEWVTFKPVKRFRSKF